VSVAIVGSAVLLGGVIEPAWEYFLEGATREWAFGALRNTALAAFTVTGVATFAGAVFLTRRGG
jgi:hypothetical protein